MDSKEGMDMAKMAVTILLVLVVISAVVALVYLAYSWFNSGAAKLGDQVNSIDSSAYSKYDDTQCTGTDVLTALKTYRDADLMIVIANGQGTCSKYKDTIGNSNANVLGYNYCALESTVTDQAAAEAGPITIGYDATKGGYHVADLNWNTNTGVTNKNTNFSPTTNKSKSETYVKTGAQFYSKLIYSDATGEMCGMMFVIMQE